MCVVFVVDGYTADRLPMHLVPALAGRLGGDPSQPAHHKRYLRSHTFIMSSDPWVLIPLSDRIASVAASVAWRGRIMVSP